MTITQLRRLARLPQMLFGVISQGYCEDPIHAGTCVLHRFALS